MNCQKPVAPAGLTTLVRPLSTNARYFMSSGTPSRARIFPITGNQRLARLWASSELLCQ